MTKKMIDEHLEFLLNCARRMDVETGLNYTDSVGVIKDYIESLRFAIEIHRGGREGL